MCYQVPRHVLDRSPPVFSYAFDGEWSYVKKRRLRCRNFGHFLQGLAWRISRSPLLAASMPTGDENTVLLEADMLKKLEEKGVPAPRLLYVCDDYFVMSHVGENLETVLNRAAPEGRQTLIEKAILALRGLHDKNLAWGGAQIRNFSLMEEKVYLFDFEEKIPPEHVDVFKVRDVLVFLFSLERAGFDPDVPALCELYDKGSENRTFENVQTLAAKIPGLKPLTWLFGRFKKMKDAKAALSLIEKVRRTASSRERL